MKPKKPFFSIILSTFLLSVCSLTFLFGTKANASFKDYQPVSYDISEWQGKITDNKAQALKNEVKFVILRVQDGMYKDKQLSNNISMMNKYNIPYGVYGFSRYANAAQANEEAQRVYNLAPDARFYVNDYEIAFNSKTNQATTSWANTMRSINGGKPVVLYSGMYKMNAFKQSTLNAYDALWLASYSKYMPQPSYSYDLWQFTSQYYSSAMGKKLDANVIPVNGKPLSFWIGNNSDNNTSNQSDGSINPNNNSTSDNNSSQNSNSNQNNNSQNTSNNNSNNGSENNTPVVTASMKKRFYTSKKITALRVIGKHGVNLYSSDGTKVGHAKKGTILDIDKLSINGTKVRAVNDTEGYYFSASKKLVKKH
ncbi:hypothetical protein M2S00_05265 [Apilactobacillus sp. TMW 2.2459]|uniref:GH25 family lysozyme n=1 Tax=Apilactobacillus xinyiensis TaxID=2841032 RepID=UPI00200BCB7E|nr:GH25 family lysozyme [Apilactobacillus xinyiensis]MCL0312514.1 hypothetical protein [Apilactobacillus xinyiensis]